MLKQASTTRVGEFTVNAVPGLGAFSVETDFSKVANLQVETVSCHTRATGKYLEDRYKSRFCYHERKLSYVKLYGIENLKEELRREYVHIRKVNKQRREELASDYKFASVKSYKTNKLSSYFYPVITFTRDDGKEYVITEADFQDVSFDVIFGILYDLKGKAFRLEDEIIALTAIVRHIKASISLAHLYDFQLGLENWSSKLFYHKPQRSLIEEEKDMVMYTVFYDADEIRISCVYPDSLGNKKGMYSHEVMLFCDDTLKMVMDGFNTRLQMDKHNVHDISAVDKVLIKHFVKEIDRRLRLKNDIRFGFIHTYSLGFELQAYSDVDYAESEYVAAASCCSQVLWMQTQLRDYGFVYKKIPIYCDSKSAITISANPVQHSKTKHIDIRYHFLKDNVEKENIELYFVNAEYQLADLFTKALDEKRFKFLISRLGVIDKKI
ncbi:hypothetical protein OSB04_024689 [Centaurea solstitialis]|uniref:Uncharacterized protein n=1 Tax=Centaurea solstitialis TaxID=347529 RepID=A0AA38W3C0_9ASTR|nr:hypothetical protein OSB04_024689 [Centaurea solstitialis]